MTLETFEQQHQIRLAACQDGAVTLGPEEVVLGLINMCQLRCVTCWYWSPYLAEPPKDFDNWKRQRMEKTECFRLFDELAELGTDKILLSGQGEPLLHPDIMEIIAYAKTKFRRLSAVTNGVCVTEEKARGLAQLLGAEDRFCVSVSGASAESYAAYHGSNASGWEQMLRALTILGEADLEDFRMFQIINSLTWHEVEEMIHLSARLNSSLSFKFASIPKGTEQFQLTAEQIKTMRNQLPRWRVLAEELKVEVNWDVFTDQLTDDHAFPIQEVGCYSGYMYSRVEADGTVYFCCRTDDVFKVGNLREHSFRDIWFNAPLMKEYRERMRQHEYFEECQSCLNWGPNWRIKGELNELDEEKTV